MVLARFIDQLYGVSEFEPNAQFYVDQIGQAQASAPFHDGQGLVAATMQGGDLLPPYQQGLSTPFQIIPERVGLAASNWAYFAAQGINMLFPWGLTHFSAGVLLGGRSCGERHDHRRSVLRHVRLGFRELRHQWRHSHTGRQFHARLWVTCTRSG